MSLVQIICSPVEVCEGWTQREREVADGKQRRWMRGKRAMHVLFARASQFLWPDWRQMRFEPLTVATRTTFRKRSLMVRGGADSRGASGLFQADNGALERLHWGFKGENGEW